MPPTKSLCTGEEGGYKGSNLCVLLTFARCYVSNADDTVD